MLRGGLQDWTTNQEGILTNPNAREEDASMELMVGEYLLRESAPPAGYTSLSHDIEIFVYSDSVIFKQYDANGGEPQHVEADENDVYTVTVLNSPGASLPSTGGKGTLLFYLSGLLMTLLGGAGLAWRRAGRYGGRTSVFNAGSS